MTTLSPWPGFAMMCVGMFMAILDVQIVAASLPGIQSALAIAPDQMSWVQTAYLTAEIIAIPLTGFLTRRLGIRRLFASAIGVFTLASIGCAASTGPASLIAWRVVQGFAGGTLIPSVFTAIFLTIPARQQPLAITLAGVLAVLAPTVGPIAGGWITTTYSWHWLFLVNVVPGLVAGIAGTMLLASPVVDRTRRPSVDAIALLLLALVLAALEIGLKEAPQRGWLSWPVLALGAVVLAGSTLFVRRTLSSAQPLVDLTTLADRSFALGCLMSFVLGTGLFGSVYLMPVFLAFVRGHDALEVGRIMLVTGLAQLVSAPIVVALERRLDGRLLTAAGFLLLAAGMGLSATQTMETDFREMILPQLLRGSAFMLCLLPPTRLALGQLSADRVPDASGLFNLMRNLGGAIGIALVDTVIYARSPVLAQGIRDRLLAGDVDTAVALGIPAELARSTMSGPVDPALRSMIEPGIAKLALVGAINEAWALIAVLTLLSLLAVPFVRRLAPSDAEPRHRSRSGGAGSST